MLVVANPFDRAPIASVLVDDLGSVDRKIARAAAFFRAHPLGLPVETRLAVLMSLRQRMREHFDLLCSTAVLEGGKPLRDTQIEVERAIAGVALAIESLEQARDPRVSHTVTATGARFEVRVAPRPIGPVAALSAFNHPLNLLVHQAVPALATGCPVIVKPSEKVPLTALLLERLVHASGCPPEAWQTVVTADVALAESLACDPRIAFLSFVGSARVGWSLRSKLPPGTRCALEHGGVAPAVLLDDADVTFAVERLAYGAFYHAGQVCISTQKLIAPRSQMRELLDALTAHVSKLQVGDPALRETDVGPLIRPAEVDRVDDWVREAIEGGAALVVGGRRRGPTLYAPTVIVNAPATSRLRAEEVFGPVLVVLPYDTEDEAIALAEHPRFAFQSSVFGRDLERCASFAERLPGSTVMINEHTAFRTDDMRFAGLRESGLGTSGIPHAMRELWVERQHILEVAARARPGPAAEVDPG